VERELPVEVSATAFGEYKCRKAVGALPLKWSRLEALAHCCNWDTLRLEEATQIGANSWNKLFHEGVLGLGATLNIKEGHVGQHTLLCLGASSSSTQNVCQHPWMGGLLPRILPGGHPPPFQQYLSLVPADFWRISLLPGCI
jgi:hypothetical protein